MTSRDKYSVLLSISGAHRHLAMRQFAIQQVANWATVVALLVAHVANPVLPDEQVRFWFVVHIAAWLARMAMFYPLARFSPEELAKRKFLFFLPLLTGFIGNAFWIWTLHVFGGVSTVMLLLVLCAGFFGISISMTGMWPVTPLTSLSYYLLLWGSFSYSLWANNHAGLLEIAALNGLVMVMMGVYIQASVGHIQAQVRRGAEIDAANNELKELRDHALSELERRSSYFQHASHDLRQRLHAIRLWVSSSMDVARSTNAAMIYPLTRVADQVDDLGRYFSSVLDLARMESNHYPIRPKEFCLHSVLQELQLRFEHLTLGHPRYVDLRVRTSQVTVVSDATVLLRMAENLVENAVAHCRDAVLVGVRRRTNAIFLDVIDNGIGIPAEHQERIFDAHYRLDSAPQAHQHGAGLGLAIVKELARHLGARIELRSIPDRGTRFRIVLPIVPG